MDYTIFVKNKALRKLLTFKPLHLCKRHQTTPMNIKTLLLGSALTITTLFGGVAQASTHLACGDNSFTIGQDHRDDYVMFHSGGRLTHSVDGIKSFGGWRWSGNNVVTSIHGQVRTWYGVGDSTCDFRY